jgi:hypothetical protein
MQMMMVLNESRARQAPYKLLNRLHAFCTWRLAAAAGSDDGDGDGSDDVVTPAADDDGL